MITERVAKQATIKEFNNSLKMALMPIIDETFHHSTKGVWYANTERFA